MCQYTWDEYYEKFYDWAQSTQIKHIANITSFGSPDEITEIAVDLCDEKAASRLIGKALDAGVRFHPSNLYDLSYSISEDCMVRVAETVEGKLTNQQLDELNGCVTDEAMNALLKKCGSGGYSPDVVMDMLCTVDDNMAEAMALNVDGAFSAEQLSELQSSLNDDVLIRLVEKAVKAGIQFPPEDVVEWANFDIPESVMVQMATTTNEKFTADQAEELYNLLPEDVYQKIAHRLGLNLHEEYDEPEAYCEPSAPKLGFFGWLGVVLAGASDGIKSQSHRHNGRCNGDCAHCPPHYGYRYGRWYYGHGHTHGCEFGGNKGGGGRD